MYSIVKTALRSKVEEYYQLSSVSYQIFKKIEKQTEAKPSFEIGYLKINMIANTKCLGVQIDDKFQ